MDPEEFLPWLNKTTGADTTRRRGRPLSETTTEPPPAQIRRLETMTDISSGRSRQPPQSQAGSSVAGLVSGFDRTAIENWSGGVAPERSLSDMLMANDPQAAREALTNRNAIDELTHIVDTAPGLLNVLGLNPEAFQTNQALFDAAMEQRRLPRAPLMGPLPQSLPASGLPRGLPRMPQLDEDLPPSAPSAPHFPQQPAPPPLRIHELPTAGSSLAGTEQPEPEAFLLPVQASGEPDDLAQIPQATPQPGDEPAKPAKPAKKRPITDDDRRRIHALNDGTRTHAEIGQHPDVNRNQTVVSRVLGEPRPATPQPGDEPAKPAKPAKKRPITDDDRRRIHALNDGTRTHAEIGQHPDVNRTSQVVSRVLGEPRPATPQPGDEPAKPAKRAKKRPITDDDRRRIHALNDGTRTHAEIGQHPDVNRNPTVVSRVLGEPRPATPDAEPPAFSGAGPSGASFDLGGGSRIPQLGSLAEAVARPWNDRDMFEIPGTEAARRFGMSTEDQPWVRFQVNGNRPVGGDRFGQGELTHILLGG